MISLNIAVIGKINAGKTSIIRLIKKERVGVVSKRHSTTSINSYSFDTDYKLNLFDTYGFKPYSPEFVKETLNKINQEIKDIDAYLYVFDAELGIDDVDTKIIDSIDRDKIIFCINKFSHDEETTESVNNIKNKFGDDIVVISNAPQFINMNEPADEQCNFVDAEQSRFEKVINTWCKEHHEQIVKLKKDRLVNTQNMSLKYAIKVFRDAMDSGIIGEETSIEEFINPILEKYTLKADEISEKESIGEESEEEEEDEEDEEEDEENEGENEEEENEVKLEESDDDEPIASELYDDTFTGIHEFKVYLNKFNPQIYQNIIQTYFDTRCSIIDDKVFCNILDFEECFGEDKNSCQSLLLHCIKTIASASTDKIKAIEDIYPSDQMDFLINKSNIVMVPKKQAQECIKFIESIIIKFTKYCLNDKTYDTVKQFIKIKLFSQHINTLRYPKISLIVSMEDTKFQKSRVIMTKKIIEDKENTDTLFDSLLNLFIELDKGLELYDEEQLDGFFLTQ